MIQDSINDQLVVERLRLTPRDTYVTRTFVVHEFRSREAVRRRRLAEQSGIVRRGKRA